MPRATKERLLEFIEEDFELAVKDWQKLTPSERWQRRATLYEFCLPKLARVEAEIEANTTTTPNLQEVDYSKLSDNALREIIAASGGDSLANIPLVTWVDSSAETD
jgi:hypothetical protein